MGYYETNVQRVASLWIDAPELKADLTTIANAIDKKLPESEIIKAGTAFRSAFVKLATHVYQHCQVSISDVPLTKRDNYIFDHFEKLQCSLSAKELNELREVFQSVGNDASHPGHPLAAKNITKWRIQDAFEKILAYIGLWITKYAPNELRQPTPWKDPHLDAIAAYKVRARNRFKELMGEEIPEGCYIDRKAKFLDRGGDETPPKDAVELLKWTTRRNARRARALNEPAINELIEKVPRSLLLAHAGMGKSIEAAALADRLTCISDGTNLSCCVALECMLFGETEPSIEGAFQFEKTVSPDLEVFAALQGWKRYLILDGYDEKLCDAKAFRQAVDIFEKKCENVHVLITSRNSDRLEDEFDDRWQAYKLLELDHDGITKYLIARWGGDQLLLSSFEIQWNQLDRFGNIRALLCRPFYLSAFAGPTGPTVKIDDLSRVRLAEGFVSRLLYRQWEKSGEENAPLTLSTKTYDELHSVLENHAFQLVSTGQIDAPHEWTEFLAGNDMLLFPRDKRFKQSEIQDYFAACALFKNPSEAKFDQLRGLEDQRRFALYGWLLECVNAEPLLTPDKKWVIDRMWADDPILVSLGLFDQLVLQTLKLPKHAWDPYEMGLLRIMRGNDAAAIAEVGEIRDLRSSSPGERLLHRLKDPDLPYLTRAVSGKLAVTRLQAAWTAAPDPWAELMPPLESIAREWIESQPSSELLSFAYDVTASRPDVERAASLAVQACEGGVDTEVLVRVLLSLADLRAQVGADAQARLTATEAINKVRPKVFEQKLSVKQLHRLLVSETKQREGASGASQDRQLGPKIGRMIYDGVDGAPSLASIKMLPLIMEIPGLRCFGGKKVGLDLAAQLWKLVVEGKAVSFVPPFTLAQSRYWWPTAESVSQTESNWISSWINYWFERLSPYEAVLLKKRGIEFSADPPGLVDASGWLQARDAITRGQTLQPDAGGARPQSHEYTREQKWHWATTAQLDELIDLLKLGLIDRSAGDAFMKSVERVDSSPNPQYWWHLVEAGVLGLSDVTRTERSLSAKVNSDPVAYELLNRIGRHLAAPSETVTLATAQCTQCPLDTRVRLVNRRKVSIQDCGAAECHRLDDVRRSIDSGETVTLHVGHPIPDGGTGYLYGFYTLELSLCDGTATGIRFRHPAFGDQMLELRDEDSRRDIAEAARRGGWRDGEVIMGFLWLRRRGNTTFTVAWHQRGFRAIGCVLLNGELVWEPPVAPERERPGR